MHWFPQSPPLPIASHSPQEPGPSLCTTSALSPVKVAIFMFAWFAVAHFRLHVLRGRKLLDLLSSSRM